MVFFFISTSVIFVSLLLALFSQEIIDIILPSQYAHAAPILALSFFAYGIALLVQLVLIGPAIIKRTYLNSVIYFIGILTNLSILYYLINIMGLIGVPLSMLIGSTVLLAISWVVTERVYPIGFSILGFVLPVLFAGLLYGITMIFSLDLLLRIGLVVVALSLYIGAIWTFRESLFYR